MAVLLLSAVQSFAPWYPFHWVGFNLNVLFHPSSWFFDGLIVASFVALASIYAKHYKLSALSTKSLSSVLQNLCKPDNLISFVGHVAAGGILARSYLGLVGQRQYSTLTLLCADVGRDRCINEPHVFLVLSGCYSGFCIWWDYHLKHGNVLHFPAIQQLGIECIRGQLSPLLKDAFSQVVWNLRWFYIGYVVFGFRVENAIGDVLHMDLYGQGSEWTLSGTLWRHVCVILQCVVLNTLLTLNVNLLRLVMNISLTQRVKFAMKSVPFGPSKEDMSSVALLDALDSELELMKYLAYQDLASLSENSRLRRADFYALSQPGGHPHNWTSLIQKCLKLIRDFSHDLNESSKQSMVIHPTANEVSQARRGAGNTNPALTAGDKNPVATRLPQQAATATAGEEKKDPVVGKRVRHFLSKVSSLISDKLTLGTSPDAAVRSVYAKSMPVIWAIKGTFKKCSC